MSMTDNEKWLRATVEAELASHPLDHPPTEGVLHELQVHQIELEIQNEALRQAQSALEESRDRYVDLYDFAPLGYLTLNVDGLIAEINLTAVKLLGAEREKLLQRRFSTLITPEDRDRWYLFFLEIVKPDGIGHLELALRRGDGTVFPAQLDCRRTGNNGSDAAVRIAVLDITARKQGEADIVEQKSRLASFALEQDRAIEAERKRLAREVHDQIGQVFTAIKLIINALPREMFPPGQEAALAEALEIGIATTRKIASELRPPLLDDLGIASALDHFVNETLQCASLSFEIDIDAQASLDATQTLPLFRISQEAINNILTHASADHVVIAGHREGDRYVLRIEDDGCGFKGGDTRKGSMGLRNMRERALLLGGSCEISSRPREGGTLVTVSLPLSHHRTDEHPAA